MYWLKRSNILFLVFIILCIAPSFFGLFHPGFFVSDDGSWMVVRFSAFYEALRSGQFPVRFLPRLNFAYGYPVADFLYPLFMYIGVPLHILGANFVTTIKIIFAGSLFASGIFAFLWLKKISGTRGAIVGSIVYVIFPYHMYDVYQRGSIGEVLALSIVPFILYVAERKKFLWTAIGIALLILAHNTLAVLFIPFLFGYFLVQKTFSLKKIISIGLLSLGLACFFWFPALYDQRYVVFNSTTVSSFTNYFIQNSNYFLLGWISLILFLGSLVVIFLKKNALCLYLFCVLLLSLFMSFPISTGVWDISHIAPFIQFPFRFLSLTLWCMSFFAAVLVDLFSKKTQIIAILILLALAYISAGNLFFPKIYQYYPDTYYSTNQDSTTVQNEYMPKWVKILPLAQPTEKAFSTSGSLSVVENRGSQLRLTASMQKTGIVFINLIDYPGWVAKIDGKKVVISHNNKNGIIELFVPQGIRTISLSFGETPVRLFADVISVISILFCVFYFILYEKSKRKH